MGCKNPKVFRRLELLCAAVSWLLREDGQMAAEAASASAPESGISWLTPASKWLPEFGKHLC